MVDVAPSRSRGPLWLVRAWIAVMVSPRQFFREHVISGKQASGLLFAMVVVLVEESTRVALVPDARSLFDGSPLLAGVVVVAVAVLLVTPTVLHLVAALQTAILMPFVNERGDTSQTVQLYCYAMAPCIVAGVPIPEVRVVATLWGFALVTIATTEVHGSWAEPAFFLSVVPASIIFGYGFRGFDAMATLLSRWYII